MSLTPSLRFLALALLLAASLAADGQADDSVPGVQRLEDPPGIHNLFALGTNVFSGSTPEGEAGFAALARLGVKTIISVDGAKPEVDVAKKYGMRYVHLPHGYDGISPERQLQLAKTIATLPGPIYAHCHHGEHRGPAAAAILCMAGQSWGPERAVAWLKMAGTSTNYSGLYQSVREFEKPTPAQIESIPADFPETAPVSGLVEAMVSVDKRWEHLRAVRAAGYRPPPDHPDIDPANEAVILWELYREAQRLPDAAHHGQDFISRLETAEAEAREAERLLRLYAAEPKPELRLQLGQTFTAMRKSCSSCHQAFRNEAD